MNRISESMKIKYKWIIFFLSALTLGFSSCGEEPITDSAITIPSGPQTELDKWIDNTFRIPYNISVVYQWNNSVDEGDIIVPPKEELVQPFLKAVLKIWLTPYIRVADNKENFMKDYSCRQLNLVGSGRYSYNAVVLGQAQNGYTITLYTVNQFDLEGKSISRATLNEFFRTMHHEFAHILNQRKPYDPNFQRITGNYSADWTILSHAQARELGFISNYARSAESEDFVEIFAYYCTSTESEWNALINTIKNTQSREYINLKAKFVRDYMKNSYNIDLEKLRDEITKAISEVANGNLEINE